MDENANKMAPSGLSNILSGIGIFILGFPLAFFLLLYISPMAIFLIFGPVETWGKQALVMTIIAIIGYGLAGYILGKIKPNLSWKSGLLLALAPILGVIMGWGLTFYADEITSLTNLLVKTFFFPVIIATVVSPLSSYLGSRSRRN